jgi:uncharacterized lipoprotein YehR (DUF1307 family)
MFNLLPFKIFESEKNLHPNSLEFLAELEKYPHKNIFTSWFKIIPRLTGRISIEGGFLPSVTKIEKRHSGDWKYMFTANGKDYGTQVSDNLHNLFDLLIKDSIKKGSPSYLNRKEIDSILDDDKWLFSNITEDNTSIYKKIQIKLHSKSGIILDFTQLNLPNLENLQKPGFISKLFDGDMGQIYFKIISTNNKELGDSTFWIVVDHIISKEDPEYYIELSNVDLITFYPKGSGVSARSTNKKMKIDVGAKTEEEAVKLIEKTALKYILKNYLVIKGSVTDETRKFVNSLYREFIKSSIGGVEANVTLDQYFKNNPLDLWFLDSLPKIKSGILRRTGLRDVSGLGRSIKSGVI